MSDVYVVGIGATRFGKFLDRSLKDLTREAVDLALKDAGVGQDVVDAGFFANATQSVMEGQHMIAGQVALRAMGFDNLPIFNIENACASGSTALHLAATHVAAGRSEIALAVGVDKMYSADKALSMSLFDGAVDVSDVDGIEAKLKDLSGADAAPEGADVRSRFMDIYASLARFHMREYGTTQEQLAIVAAKNHHHSTFNPLAQYRQDFTPDEVMAARVISWPLTLPMCAAIGDGAAAVLVCSQSALKRFDRARAIRLMASELSGSSERGAAEFDRHVCRIAADRAYEKAGIGPNDISVVEVHDATSFAEIQQTENLGLCAIGEGGRLAQSGATALGGRVPVNPSGGLVSKGHPIGATGLAQVHELVMQLRGEAGARQVEGARFAIAENGGGFYGVEEAVACVTILGR
ncbi:thiolase family protein [Xanthobacteraceae bacterium A53D]